jgi:hypothetical protein
VRLVVCQLRAERRRAMKGFMLFVTFAVLAGVLAAVGAPAAAAAPPGRSQFAFSDTGVLADVCAFPIAVSATGSATETDFFDTTGAVVRVQLHVTEQTTYSANGNSLTTVPFTYNITVLFDNSGNPTDAFVSGVIARIPLPGGLVIIAGRVDLAAHGFPQFTLTPDAGATVNLDRFCAALAA